MSDIEDARDQPPLTPFEHIVFGFFAIIFIVLVRLPIPWLLKKTIWRKKILDTE